MERGLVLRRSQNGERTGTEEESERREDRTEEESEWREDPY